MIEAMDMYSKKFKALADTYNLKVVLEGNKNEFMNKKNVIEIDYVSTFGCLYFDYDLNKNLLSLNDVTHYRHDNPRMGLYDYKESTHEYKALAIYKTLFIPYTNVGYTKKPELIIDKILKYYTKEENKYKNYLIKIDKEIILGKKKVDITFDQVKSILDDLLHNIKYNSSETLNDKDKFINKITYDCGDDMLFIEVSAKLICIIYKNDVIRIKSLDVFSKKMQNFSEVIYG